MTTVRFSNTRAGGQARTPGAAAWACTQLGLRVFPLVPGSGLPAMTKWPDLATADEAQVEDWWCGEYSGYGVGIACGPSSGVWVLDIDRKHGINGFASLHRLFTERSENPHGLLTTLAVATPSGGAHLYFRWTAECEAGANEVEGEGEGPVYNSTGKTNRLGPGLDVRADRGYVRAPGWAGYDVIPRNGKRHTAISAAPGWLVALAKRGPRRRVAPNMSTGADAREWSARALMVLERAEEGSRNHQLNRCAFQLGAAGVLTEAQAWAACSNALVSMGAGDGMDRWRRTFESGWNAGCRVRDKA